MSNKAVKVTKAGKTDFQLEELTESIPVCEEDEVLVKVMSCGVCFRDIIDKEGGNPYLQVPLALGHEIAGVIVGVGKNVKKWKEGDRIINGHNAPCEDCNFCNNGNRHRCIANPTYMYGLSHDGGYQQYVCMHQNSLFSLPDAIPFEHACFLLCTAGVALRGLRKANFQRGQKVLITGGSGGVGIHAIQLVKGLGGIVYTITSNHEKQQTLVDAGADFVMVSKSPAFHSQFVEQFGLVDIALELVGEPTLNSSLRCLNLMGKLVVIGNITATPIKVNLGFLILKEISIIGSSGAIQQDMVDVFDLVKKNKLKPVIYKVLPLSKQSVEIAHNLMKTKGVVGRIVLSPSQISSSL